MSFLAKIFGDPNTREIEKIKPLVEKINKLESAFESFLDGQFLEQTQDFKSRLSGSETIDDILPEAFACVREAAKRTLEQRHFDCQLIGGVVLHQGKIAEMKTGEGKTLVATLPAYLNALEGGGVHIVTVNDYLARRDANWMGPVYHFLGLTVGCINHDKSYVFEPKANPDKNEATIEMINLKEVSRQEAYKADIVYGTNNEYGFDYLRDNMAQDLNEMAQRALHYVIIDEIDSILIDEARTPLIISVPDEESNKMYEQFARLVPRLKENTDYNIDEKMRAVTITEEGLAKMEQILGLGNIYDYAGIRQVHHLEQALKAHALFKRDRDYVVKNGEVIIVDEFTGRLMPGRRFSEGLHQALEAKEGVMVQKESRTLATITFQNYFKLYKKLSGMTGTAITSAEEFHKVYNLDVIVIPTNQLLTRMDLPDLIYKSEMGKFKAVIVEIKKCHETGQPVLVGTVSIEKNELLSALLKREGIAHQVLNAKYHEQEAQIISQAGRLGAVTIATNMAGRGVDIILGGRVDEFTSKNEWQVVHDRIISLGGLRIIGTERHEARRIDNQLRGRAGRQGDPGQTQFFISVEDDLMRIFGSEKIKNMMEFLKVPEDQPIEGKMISTAIESAQSKIEGYNFDIRKHVLEYDNVMDKQRETIYKKRREILRADGGGLKQSLLKMISDEISKIIDFHTLADSPDEWNIKEVYESIGSIFDLPSEAPDRLKEYKDKEKMFDYLRDLMQTAYENKEKEVGAENMRQIEKMLVLRTNDMLWMDHLENMEHLRDSVRLRAYGQRDPLVEYKNEGHKIFQDLLATIQNNIVGMIFKVSLKAVGVTNDVVSVGEGVGLPAKGNKTPPFVKTSEGKKVGLPAVASAKVGRNDPCPCESGKKYKRCHGK